MSTDFKAGVPIRRLFDLDVMALDFEQAVDLLARIGDTRQGPARVVVTPNTDHVVRLAKDPALKREYARADCIFADGMPVVWASRLLGRPLPARVTGADLFVALCQRAVRQKWRLLLIGGRPGEEAEIRARFETYYPGLDIEIASPSMRFDPLGEEGQRFAERVRAVAPHFVFVCLGLPKQERWALHHAPSFPGGAVLCVGAAMEFAIGLKQRAPLWMQRTGLEWLWRLLSDPRRMARRYLIDDPFFVTLVWREWRASRRSA